MRVLAGGLLIAAIIGWFVAYENAKTINRWESRYHSCLDALAASDGVKK